MNKVTLPSGTDYALLSTEIAPKPNKRTGLLPPEAEQAEWQRILPIMNGILQEKGFVKVAEGKVLVTGMRGRLEKGWQQKVQAFVARLPVASTQA